MDSQARALLERTSQYFAEHGRRAYLVGGSLRDLLLGEPCRDWDIVVEGDAHGLARRLANMLGGHYVHMHDKASRVIVRQGESVADTFLMDIAPLNGASIEDDLRQRDFTINAMAAPLEAMAHAIRVGSSDEGWSGQPGQVGDHEGRPYSTSGWQEKHPFSGLGSQVIDPFHGRRDIQARRLRAVDKRIFQHDPLRMLRAVRLAARYGLTIENATRGLIRRDAALLPTVASERIHDELYAILESPGTTAQLRLLDDLGLLTVLFPELSLARGMQQPYPHFWDVLEHSLETVGALERIAGMLMGARFIAPSSAGSSPDVDAMNRVPTNVGNTGQGIADSGEIEEIRNIVEEAREQGIFAFETLTAPRMKMAALLHDIGKPVTFSIGEDGGIHFYNHPRAGVPLVQHIARRLNISTQDRRLWEQVAAHHMRPGQLGQDGLVTTRAIRRYFVDLGPTGMLVAIFSLADHLATCGPQPLGDAWERHLAVVRLLLASYVRERQSILPPRLLSADELMHRLKLEPGPLIGKLLAAIEEAQAEGTVSSKEEALWLAEEMLKG